MKPEDISQQPTISPQAIAQDPLAQLQDIQVPAEIGLWPPAWGWWILALVILLAGCALVLFFKQRYSRNAYRTLAMAELTKLKNTYTSEQNSDYLQALSILLRRTALSGFGSQFNASLKGESWLEWLDQQCPATQSGFAQGVGRTLLMGPYQKAPEFDRNSLHELSLLWIKSHRNQWQGLKKVSAKTEAEHRV